MSRNLRLDKFSSIRADSVEMAEMIESFHWPVMRNHQTLINFFRSVTEENGQVTTESPDNGKN